MKPKVEGKLLCSCQIGGRPTYVSAIKGLTALGRHGEVTPYETAFNIKVDPDLPADLLLETLIHEALHCQDWKASEVEVTTRAAEISVLLQHILRITKRKT